MYEMVVGLQIKDDTKYTQYREAMMPILKDHGGGFRYDFKISEVLKNEENRDINRVFTINFSDKNNMEKFFSHPKYLEIKEKFFIDSVADTTIIAEYELNSH